MIPTVALVLLGACGTVSQEERPNVVLVMSDDQGLGDFSHAGHGVLATPNLDRLAAASPQVKRFYVSPVCSPTRACLMTGRYNYRTRVVDTWIGRSMMEPDEVTVAEILNAAGYATGIFGKWHLGDCYPLRPIDQGFEVALVHRGGGLAQPSEPPANAGRYTDPILFRNGEEVQTKGYCTDVYFDAALEFIDASLAAERPFFAYVATNAPHGPYGDVPEDLYEKYAESDLEPTLRGKSDQVDREAKICAMVENIDRNVGRLLDHLERRGITRETIVVFLNDNGPVGGRYTRGLRGSKSSVYEGGIRAPLFVRWPGQLSPATEVEPITAHIDLLPTILAATGVPVPSGLHLDGRDLLPLLKGEGAGWSERTLFLQTHRGNTPGFERHFAVIDQRWKLVRASGFGK
ncbi:MAG: arylsulfatase, partial [Deltaproteobacteria bacterium]|nr:arylsulfatase [Deltaproteobacteria bacterium]